MTEDKISIKKLVDMIKQLPKTFYILLKVDKLLFSSIMIISVITGLIPVVTLMISQELLNSLSIKSEISVSIKILVIYIAVSMASYLIDEAQTYVSSYYQNKLQYRLQFMLMEKCTQLDLRDFESSETYNKIDKISAEIGYRPYQSFCSLISIISSVVTMISSVTIIMSWKPAMAGIMLIIPIISMGYYMKIGQKEFSMVWKRANDERRLWYYNHLLTHDFSYKEVKVLGVAKYMLKKYKDISNTFINQNRSILNKKTIFDSVYGAIIQIVGFIVISFAIVSCFMNELLIGNVVSLIRAVGMVQGKSRSIMISVCALYSNSLYMEMLFEFLNQINEKENEKTGTETLSEINSITLSNVCFGYKDGKNTINNLNLKLEKGKRIAIVGPNGSGKSTLLKLIAGLYEPSKGDIFINSKPLKKIKKENYYSKIAILFQDYVKYQLTLRENVVFGDINKEANDASIKNNLAAMKTDFLKDEKGKFNLDMQLGNWFDDGRDLSQGQWQKVALARTCYKNADFYILDEPNAALDTVSEKEVFDTFFRLVEGKIGVYISHRLNSAKVADEIIVMNKGEIVAIGKHEELLENCETYRTLYEAENYDTENAIEGRVGKAS